MSDKSAKSKKASGKQPRKQAIPPQYSVQRYVWMGAALGLYFGWFFRPAREPSFLLAIFLGVVIALILLILPSFMNFLALAYSSLKMNAPPFLERLKLLPFNIVQYILILVVFEARHYALDWGGRIAVMALTTITGALFGYWVMIRKDRFGL